MDIQQYTRRQIGLFYREALRREHYARADRIDDTNLAFWGGKKAADFVKKLRRT